VKRENKKLRKLFFVCCYAMCVIHPALPQRMLKNEPRAKLSPAARAHLPQRKQQAPAGDAHVGQGLALTLA